MADVSLAGGRDRAQLIIVSGLMLAVTMLVLVLLLNTAIYTENVATRGIDSDVGDAAQYQQTVNEELARILAEERGDDRESVHDNVSNATGMLLDQQANISIRRGHVAQFEEPALLSGVNVSSETMEDGSIVTDADHARRFILSIDSTAWDDPDAYVINVNDESFSLNGTGQGLEFRDGDGETLCETDEAVTFAIVNGTKHNATGATSCIGDLWANLTESGASFDVSVETHGSPGAVEFTFVGGGANIAPAGAYDAVWFVDSVTIEWVYLTADLRYETTQTIERVLDP